VLRFIFFHLEEPLYASLFNLLLFANYNGFDVVVRRENNIKNKDLLNKCANIANCMLKLGPIYSQLFNPI
jgi:hypothetical protein